MDAQTSLLPVSTTPASSYTGETLSFGSSSDATDRTSLTDALATPSTRPRRSRSAVTMMTKDFVKAFAFAFALALGVVALADAYVGKGEGVAFTSAFTSPRLGRNWNSAASLAAHEHVELHAKRFRGRGEFVPREAHKVVVLTVSTGDNLAQTYEWATSLKDAGVLKFMIGCVDSKCLKPMQALDAPVFDASAESEEFAMKGQSKEDASRWASVKVAYELVNLGYTVMMTAPTTRFRRNPMEVIAESIARHGGHSVFAMRGVHDADVKASDLEAWTVPGSTATLRDDFLIFTPGSQPLIAHVLTSFKDTIPEDVLQQETAVDGLGKDEAEFNWRSNVAFVLNHQLSKNSGLRWKKPSGEPVDAAPFAIKPQEVNMESALVGDDGRVKGFIGEVSGEARFAGRSVTVVLLDPIVARAHCNDVGGEMSKTYVVACDLDDRSLAGRRVEVDHQCMLLKALEYVGKNPTGLGSLLGFLEHHGESPIHDSKGFLGALDACRL